MQWWFQSKHHWETSQLGRLALKINVERLAFSKFSWHVNQLTNFGRSIWLSDCFGCSATSFGGIDVCYAPSSDLSENNHAAINWPRICCRSRPPCRLWIVHWTGLKTSVEICQCNSGMRTTPQSHSCTNCVDCSCFGSAVRSCWAIARNCASCCFPRSLCEIAVLNGGSLRHLFPTRNYFASCTCC